MRRFFAVLLGLSLLFFVSACRAPSAPALFRADAEKMLSLPVGRWYESGADEWEATFLPVSIRSAFFTCSVDGVAWVLYLGVESECFCEIFYGVCEAQSDAVALAETLAARLDRLKKQADGAFSESFSDAAVYCRGRSVLYTACPKNDAVLRLF